MKTEREIALEKELEQVRAHRIRNEQRKLKQKYPCPFKVGNIIDYTEHYGHGKSNIPNSSHHVDIVEEINYTEKGWVAKLNRDCGKRILLAREIDTGGDGKGNYTTIHRIGEIIWRIPNGNA
jgi:hypothetical protein